MLHNDVVVSTRTEYSLDDVLTPEELQKLGNPDLVREEPDAQVAEWESVSAVTTHGASIASSMDRFSAGNLTPAQADTLEGLHREFTENGERVVFVSEKLRQLLGDKAVARLEDFDEGYAVAVRSPEEVEEVIERYSQQYTGNVEQHFRDRIESNHAVMPALYDASGVIDETGVALMEGEGILKSDDGKNLDQLMQQDLEGEMDPNEININRYEAPEPADAEYFVDVMLPAGYEEVDHDVKRDSLVIEADGEKAMKSLPEINEVLDYEENNGIYTVEIR